MKALKKEYFLILLLSFLIFFFKWFLSYWNFGTEDVFTKIIFNPYGDHSYYPFVKQLSEFNFSEGYSIFFTKLNLVGFPYLVSIFHAFFYKIFGLYGFIFLEFVFISVFLFIFFFIFKELKFNNIISILLSLIFFSLPQLLYILEGFSIPYTFNLKLLYSSFYSLRFPRPLVSNIFLFAVYLFFIKFYISEDIQKSKKYFYICGMLIGFQFSSFFYFSIVSFITAIFLFYFRAKNTLNLKEIFKSYILFLLIFSLFCLPFLIQLIFIEPDYLGRVGAFEINNENRFYLFQHLLEGFKKIEFILLIILNFLLYFYNVKKNIFSKKILDIFLSIFLFSIVTPFFYLIIFKTITFFNYFVFIIIISGFILLKINFLFLLKNVFSLKNINTFKILPLFIFLLFINYNYFHKTYDLKSLSTGIHFNPKNLDNFRKDFQKVTNVINKNEEKLSKNDLLLSNDLHVQSWWIFSNYKHYYFPYVFYTSLSDDMVEFQLINAFKYLNLDEDDFIDFFDQNKISSWRVVNSHNYFFLGHLKYQANYLKKFSSLPDYPKETWNFISKKSIHHTNQVILPFSEIERLRKKFKITNVENKLKPNLIILNKNDYLSKNIIYNENYCIVHENSNFLVFFDQENSLCKKING